MPTENRRAARTLSLRLACAVALAVAASPSSAQADDSHYQNFIPGEKAAGMGGAYTGIAADPSGNYYNPAGLADATADTLSANVSFYGFQQQSLSNALHVKAGNILENVSNSVSAAVAQLNTVPALAGSMNGIGERDARGHYKHAWALSVIVPDDQNSTTTSYALNAAGTLESLSRTTFDQTALASLGYGRRLDERWSVGISGNVIYRQLTQRTRSIAAQGYGTAGPSQSYFSDDIQLKLAVAGVYLQAGVLFRLTPSLTLGATIATPSWTIFSNVNTDEVTTAAGNGAPGLTETYQPNLSGDTRWPVHGRLGAAYRFRPDILVALDFSLWGITHYGLVNGTSATARLPNFVTNVDRVATFNLNLGAEFHVWTKYSLRVGLFSNRSSAPGIDGSPNPQLDNVDLYGASVGFTIPSKHTQTTFGLLGSYGEGQSKTPTASTATQALTYASGSASQLFINLVVGGSYQF